MEPTADRGPLRGPLATALARVPPVVLFVGSAVSLYAGAAIAVRTFDRVPPIGVAWWRQVGAAVVLVSIRRPWRRRWTRAELITAACLGVVTALMNTLFYVAIESLPLGTAVAIEFIGPIAVGAATARTPRAVVAVLLGGLGVMTLAGIELGGSTGGLVAICAAAGCWAGYIVLGSHVAGGAGIDGLAVGTAFAAVVGAVPLWHWSSPALDGGWTLVASLLAVGVLSNAVPYGLDQIVMARVGMARFSVLLAILPATATVMGAVVLSQQPTLPELLGIALVVVAVALNERRRDTSLVEPG